MSFVDKQSRILNEPVFGEIADKDVGHGGHAKPKPKWDRPVKSKGIVASNVVSSGSGPSVKEKNPGSLGDYQHCLYCKGNHALDLCRHLRYKQNAEKIQFLRSHGLCFGCLAKDGHLSKDCTKRLTCILCSESHPTVLHPKPAD
jgi:hypothetical protein